MATARPGEIISHYEVQALLGGGAMGEVYRVRDTRLQCTRALKLLRQPCAGDPLERSRFLREARAAAALNHPGICTVHEIDEVDGRAFIVMEYVPGQDLAARIAAGPLPPAEALRIAQEIGEALRAAHAAGIVHRDIKPRNIRLMPDGHVKIVDFGLAKLAGAEELTRSGAVAGTPAYMAPEQARGFPVDGRCDLWSLGVVLYEMLSGHPPFPGRQGMAALYAICNEAPQPLPALAGAPPGLAAVIHRCLDKNPGHRYPDADAFLADLAALSPSLTPAARARPRLPRRRFLWAGAALVTAGLLLAPLLRSWRSTELPAQVHMALLPIEVIGGSERDRALAAGLVWHLNTQLTRLERLQRDFSVIPACDIEASEVASSRDAQRVFGANLVVAGSMTPLGDALALTLTLIDPRGPRQLGAAEFSVPRQDALRLQTEALAQLMRLLELKLAKREPGAAHASETPTSQVLADYLTGLGYLQNLDSLGDPERLARVDSALAAFGLAVAGDPQFAAALAGQAEAGWRRYELTREETWSEAALQSCTAALNIDPGLPAGLLARATIRAGRGEYERALTDFRAVLARDSLDVQAQRGLAAAYAALGDTARAEATYLAALAVQPADHVTRKEMGIFYYHQGRFADAVAQFEALIAAAPENYFLGHNQLGGIYLQEGKLELARAAFTRSLAIKPNYRAFTNLAAVDYREGDYEQAVAHIKEALAIHSHDYRVWGNLADTFMRLPERRAEAEAAYRQAAALAEARLHVNPRDARVMCSLAGYYAGLGEPQRALQLLGDARGTGILDLESLYQIGHSYERLGRRDEALGCLDEALRRGFSPRRIEQAPTLRALREDPRWAKLVAGLEESR